MKEPRRQFASGVFSVDFGVHLFIQTGVFGHCVFFGGILFDYVLRETPQGITETAKHR